LKTGIERLHVYSSGATAPPLQKAAKTFQDQFKTEVDFTIGKAEALLSQIMDKKEGDLLSCGAEYILDEASEKKLIVRNTTKSVGYRRSVILVPIGNPKKITSLNDLTNEGMRVGIATEGCLLGVWDDICSKAGLTDAIRRNITEFAAGCGAVMALVHTGKVDAIFGWNAFRNIWPKTTEIVELPKELQVYRSTGVAVVEYSNKKHLASSLINVLTSREGRAIYADYGWIHRL
jgi:accessory colonization factor AcfC